ncbi:solute carrier family 22 member 18 isoform X2 [Mustela putorius furo]|uniref:Solute carrier family 22 member 18 isoform X2 n=1 Tax=Mustela putorius furo TaxID=9669 RepID=A0A8U0SYJ3_MUSPF|nr:solute carrier family 22 member 18 isoform X2 [Mustela putorius furo]
MRGTGAAGGHGQRSSRMGSLGRSQVVILSYVLVALELTCLFMRFSIMPYLTRQLGLDSVAFGYLQTAFGVLQLLGGPVFGRFADQHGARAAFTLSFLAASAFYLLLAAACSPALPGVALLYALPLPAALMHGLPAAQMVIADLSAPEERPAALGRLGLCFGVGMISGSLLGGTLSAACGLQCPASVALVANLVAAILSFTCIPISTKGVSADAPVAPPGRPDAGVFDLKAISRLLLRPGVLPVFLIKVVSGFPSGHSGRGHRPAEQLLLRGGPAPGRRASLRGRGAGHGPDVQRLPLLPPDAWPGLQPVRPQRGHRQHADQGCPSVRHGDHAGPLRLRAAPDSHPGAHRGRPPLPQLWGPHLWPRAVCHQCPCPPGALETASAPEDGQSPVTTVPEHRLAIKPSSSLISAKSCGLNRAVGGERQRDGEAGELPGGGAGRRAPGLLRERCCPS